MSDAFDFGYLEPRETTRFTLTGVHVRSEKPLVLLLGYGGPGSPLRAALDSGKVKGTPDDQLLVELMTIAVKGWENAFEKDGSPVPCVPDEIRDLTQKLVKRKRSDLVWMALNHAVDPTKYCEAPTAEQLGKA